MALRWVPYPAIGDYAPRPCLPGAQRRNLVMDRIELSSHLTSLYSYREKHQNNRELFSLQYHGESSYRRRTRLLIMANRCCSIVASSNNGCSQFRQLERTLNLNLCRNHAEMAYLPYCRRFCEYWIHPESAMRPESLCTTAQIFTNVISTDPASA
jgi:hypothetical protein